MIRAEQKLNAAGAHIELNDYQTGVRLLGEVLTEVASAIRILSHYKIREVNAEQAQLSEAYRALMDRMCSQR